MTALLFANKPGSPPSPGPLWANRHAKLAFVRMRDKRKRLIVVIIYNLSVPCLSQVVLCISLEAETT